MMSLKFKINPVPTRQFQKSGPVVLSAVAKTLDPLHELRTSLLGQETTPNLHIYFIISPDEGTFGTSRYKGRNKDNTVSIFTFIVTVVAAHNP